LHTFTPIADNGRGGGTLACWQAAPPLRIRLQEARLPQEDHGDLDWNSIPTCKSKNLNVEYLMLRGYFMPPGVSKDVVAY
jgi:hypothetical protein